MTDKFHACFLWFSPVTTNNQEQQGQNGFYALNSAICYRHKELILLWYLDFCQCCSKFISPVLEYKHLFSFFSSTSSGEIKIISWDLPDTTT